ncbi:hypothetical protein SYNTR_1333 [Candidatus Syntrophocurvum alkaliphilum]|uniref:DUF3784 domain-containing protein n=1 Tax=Candidatus Syntrophocurvum alkaliphilum TaxID=2293317 RepID=A0A6I6DFL1_9FIRM|nr:DUF3784 domain-containing protein [Candidatus Syntrophocurvum alkaliphilum]QGT99926.1 hypothetical protein SYNTR_1333 [Candidatus Syntrophocurvum alkaliphilum]
MGLLIIHGVIALLLVGMGIIIKHFGGESLIAGYNTASKEAQDYMRAKGIGRFIGDYLYLLAAIIILGSIGYSFDLNYSITISWILFIIVTILMVIKAQKFTPQK